MNPVIIGAIITGSLTLIGAIRAAVITTRVKSSQIPTNRRPSEAVALFENATATIKALAFVFAGLCGFIVLVALALVLVL